MDPNRTSPARMDATASSIRVRTRHVAFARRPSQDDNDNDNQGAVVVPPPPVAATAVAGNGNGDSAPNGAPQPPNDAPDPPVPVLRLDPRFPAAVRQRNARRTGEQQGANNNADAFAPPPLLRRPLRAGASVPTAAAGATVRYRVRIQRHGEHQLGGIDNRTVAAAAVDRTARAVRAMQEAERVHLANTNNTGNAAAPFVIPADLRNAHAPSITTTTTDNGSFLTYAATAPPLTAQALADTRQELVDEQVYRDHSTDLEQYKCPICFEFLKNPAGCGQCTTRFCFDCLSQVLRQPRRPAAEAQCPVCRHGLQAIQRDEPFMEQLAAVESIPCRYRDCNELLALPQVAPHEATCASVRVSCTYQEYGCAWTGTRAECESHECAYSNVSLLVTQVRTMRADYGARYQHLYNRLRHTDALTASAHKHMLRANTAATRSTPCNPVELLSFIVALTCSTPYFLWQKNRYTNMFATPAGRAVVHNTLSLFPTLLMAIKFVVSGYRQLVNALSVLSTLSNQTKDEMIDLSLVLMVVATLTVLILVCLHVDCKSAHGWQSAAVPKLGQQRVIKHVFTVSLVALHAFMLDWTGPTPAAVLTALWVAVSTAAFPAFIASASLRTHSQAPYLNAQLFSIGRVSYPALIGLRYGFLIAVLGFLPVLDAVALLTVVQKRLGLRLIAANLVREDVSAWLVGFHFSYKVSTLLKHGFYGTKFPIATLALLVFRLGFPRLAIMGAKLGERLITNAKVHVLPNGRGVQKDFSGIGISVFGAWAFVSLLIVMS